MKYIELTCGQMVKEIRKTRNISQEKLATELGISRGYLSEIESDRKRPSRWIRVCIRALHIKHCSFKKQVKLVEVMTPEQPKLSWFKRLIGWIKEK